MSEPSEPKPATVNTDDDTKELPVLNFDDLEENGTTLEAPNPSENSESRESTSESRASSWVGDMETEIVQLQERWRTLDRELRRSEERLAKFRAESAEKDQTIADLNAEIAGGLSRIDELNGKIVARDSSIASLESANAEQETKLAEKSEMLDAARGEASVLDDRFQAALKDMDEHRRITGDDRTRLVELRAERDEFVAKNEQLATRVQDLEAYIEGRREKWTEFRVELESSKARVAELETTNAAGVKRLELRESEIESFQERVVELERLRSEAEGRHKERESAFKETQTRLTEQAGEIERLRIVAKDWDSRLDLANKTAELHREEVDAHKLLLSSKDESIHKLESEIESGRVLRDHMEAQIADDKKQINDFQRELGEQRFVRERLSDDLTEARDQNRSLGEQLTDSLTRVEALEEQNASRQSQIADLENDIAQKNGLISGFDRNAKRLLALRQSLRSVSEDEGEQEVTDAKTTQSLLSDVDSETGGVTKPTDRKFVPLSADAVSRAEYSLSGSITTIGRGDSSDIRIQDEIVSRLHAQVTTDKENTIIEDLGSRNGVLVNSHRVDRAVLQNGDIISFGANHDFRYVETGQATH